MEGEIKKLDIEFNASPGNVGKVTSEVAERIDDVKESASEMGSTTGKALDTVASKGSKTRKIFTQISKVLEDGGSNAKKKIGGIAKVVGNKAISGLGTQFGNMGKKVKNAFSGLFNVAKYRIFRTLIKSITQAFRTGLANIYAYSRAMGTSLAPAMDRIATATLYMKNSLGSVLAPILTYLAPIVDSLADKFVECANAIAMFFARLTGAKTWTKAIKGATSYGGAIDGATGSAEKLKETLDLLDFDQINRLSDKNDGAGGGGGGSGSGAASGMYFTEVSNATSELADLLNNGLWEEAGKHISDGLANALNDIDWDKIRTKASNFGRNFGLFITGLFEGEAGGKSIGYLIGETIANGLNTAVDFLYNFVKNVDFGKVGLEIGRTIGSAIANIDYLNVLKLIFEGLVKALAGAIGLIAGFVDALGQGISDRLKSWWQEKGLDWFTDKTVTIKTAVSGSTAVTTLKDAWESIKTKTAKLTTKLAGKTESAITKLKNAWTSIKSKTATITLNLKSKVADIKGWINKYVIDALNSKLKSTKLFSSFKIPHLATGGMVDSGQLFVARERGAEMVGAIGGHTAVANNDQIVEGISAGVYNAVRSAMSGQSNNVTIVLEGDAKGLFRAVRKEAKAYTQATGQPSFAL